MRVLKLGCVGPDVANWQQFLITRQINTGGVDGDFGDLTKTATEAFQRGTNLVDDGIVGNATVAAAIPLGYQALPNSNDVAPSSSASKITRIAEVDVHQLEDGSATFYTAGMDVDADGGPQAYHPKGNGLDSNTNAKDGSTWVGIVVDGRGDPVVQGEGDPAPGFYVSTTALQDESKSSSDPSRYLDSTSIPYIVIPGGRLGRARLGHPVLVIDQKTGRRVKGVVGDIGPRSKIGEASMCLAAFIIGEPIYTLNDPNRQKFSNPREGGTPEKRFRYIIFTALPALDWPRDLSQLEAAVDGCLANFTHEQLLTVST